MKLRIKNHERFAQLVAKGEMLFNAYGTVYPRSRKWKKNALYQRAHELAKRPDVKARIDELLQVGADDTIASRRELAQFMTRVVRTPISNVDEDSDLAQEKTVKVIGEDATVEKIRMPDKLGAAERLSKLMGYDEPEKTESTVKFQPDEAVLKKLGGS